jgi:3-dehydroquinate synthase
MNKLTFNAASGRSEIFIGADWKSALERTDLSGTIIITDTNVRSIYGAGFPDIPVITLEAGEESKNISTIERILKELLGLGADRSSFLLGIGGGVVCDITGFAASIYMRGIRFGFVSTTLLSQVDASIGGKNGVNLSGTKNIVGTFTHPEFVICDQDMLDTLPDAEYISGLGEVAKHALIRDEKMIGYLEENIEDIIRRDKVVLGNLIMRSVEIKSEIVAHDERETGERRLLNFGHTIGHAIEAVTGARHGIAIAHGMMIASELSFDDKMLDIAEIGRIRSLLERLGLLSEINFDRKEIIEFLLRDKKRENENIHFVFLDKPGHALVKLVSLQDIAERISLINY